MKFLEYTDCTGSKRLLDKYHMHEIIDRVHLIQEQIECFIERHPAGALVEEEMSEVQSILSKVYQKLGEIDFDNFKSIS